MAEMDSAETVQSEISSTDRIEVLKQKHATLETALENENNRPMPDSSVVANLKREKLAIKDELQRLDTA
ncbi:MAG: YdcH family protein [Rhodospirillaceae bacterium]|nr:YdcH family protein [Rhodospirillaceae bacterium]MDD9918549.1 YdcH family protein [Rhodospirillaceae bacterium]MDD9926969.1 YdcH family protein [Rhodospirillaceae bacterium]